MIMRTLTQSEVIIVSGSACDYQPIGIFAFNLFFVGYYYLYSQDVINFDDFRILPITMVSVNMSF